MNTFESIYYWKGNKQYAVLGLLQRLPNALVHCSLAQEVAQLEIVVTVLESSRIHKGWKYIGNCGACVWALGIQQSWDGSAGGGARGLLHSLEQFNVKREKKKKAKLKIGCTSWMEGYSWKKMVLLGFKWEFKIASFNLTSCRTHAWRFYLIVLWQGQTHSVSNYFGSQSVFLCMSTFKRDGK